MTTFLKKLRQEQDISQEFLAKEIGLSRPTYAQIENGLREVSLKEAQDLAEFFGIPLESFITKEDNSKPTKKRDRKTVVSKEKKDKFKEVILYILEKIGARPNIGEAVICKLLYFIDFDYYEKYEEQLTGVNYIKNHFGPTPAAFNEIINEMEKDDEIVRVTKKYFQHDQKKYLPLRSANLSNFSVQEKEHIDWEIERFKDFNASKIKKYSHKDVPWIGTDELEIIDYEAVFARTDELSVRDYDDL